MDPILGSALISGGAQVANSTGNFLSDLMNRRYNRQLQERIFDREDNAVQRRAEDLEAAGLSKTLAAGGGANAGQAIKLDAPHFEGGAAEAAYRGARSAQDIATSREQKRLVQEQANGVSLDNALKAATLDTSIKSKEADLNTKIQDLALKVSNMQANEIEAQAKANIAVANSLITSYGAESARLNNLKKQYEIEIIQKTGLDKARAAVVAAQLANEQLAFELDFYKKSGLPKGGLLDQIIRGLKGEVNPYEYK